MNNGSHQLETNKKPATETFDFLIKVYGDDTLLKTMFLNGTKLSRG